MKKLLLLLLCSPWALLAQSSQPTKIGVPNWAATPPASSQPIDSESHAPIQEPQTPASQGWNARLENIQTLEQASVVFSAKAKKAPATASKAARRLPSIRYIEAGEEGRLIAFSALRVSGTGATTLGTLFVATSLVVPFLSNFVPNEDGDIEPTTLEETRGLMLSGSVMMLGGVVLHSGMRVWMWFDTSQARLDERKEQRENSKNF